MKQQKRPFRITRVMGLALGTLGVVAAIVFARHDIDRRGSRATAAVQPLTDSAVSESEIRDRDIAFYERRAAEDTASAGDRSQLAILYMDRARAVARQCVVSRRPRRRRFKES